MDCVFHFVYIFHLKEEIFSGLSGGDIKQHSLHKEVQFKNTRFTNLHFIPEVGGRRLPPMFQSTPQIHHLPSTDVDFLVYCNKGILKETFGQHNTQSNSKAPDTRCK